MKPPVHIVITGLPTVYIVVSGKKAKFRCKDKRYEGEGVLEDKWSSAYVHAQARAIFSKLMLPEPHIVLLEVLSAPAQAA